MFERFCKNKTQDNMKFYPHGARLTEDIAIQRVVMLANNILDIAEHSQENFKITVGYRALNKLLHKYSHNTKIPDVFKRISNQSAENITYCIKPGSRSMKHPQMYFNNELNKKTNKEGKYFIQTESFFNAYLTGKRNPRVFLGIFKGEISLFDLIIKAKDSCFLEDLMHLDIINFYYKFDIKHDKSEEMTNTSKMYIVFQVARKNFLITYKWTLNLNSFLAGRVKPRLDVSSTSLKELLKECREYENFVDYN